MGIAPRPDDFATRRAPLQPMTDDVLQAYCWRLVDTLVQPLVEAARTHTSPSIERSGLLRMGFSSLEARALANTMLEKGLLGHGPRTLATLRNRQEAFLGTELAYTPSRRTSVLVPRLQGTMVDVQIQRVITFDALVAAIAPAREGV